MTDYATQPFVSAEAYLVSAMSEKMKKLPHVKAGEEFTISDLLDPILDNAVAIKAIRTALEDGTRHGQKAFKAGFEAGRQQILSCLSPGIQAEILGAIDLDDLAMAEAVEATVEFKKNWDDRGLTCKRCGTKWLDDRTTGARCPKCDRQVS